MRKVIAAVAMVVVAGAVEAKEIIRCKSAGHDDLVVTLDDKRMLKRVVSCVSGGGFIADMTPCAPSGAFGLSAGTGAAELVQIVNRWQDATKHTGAVVGHFATPTVVYFNAGTYGDSVFEEAWSFMLDRKTGAGTLRLNGEPALSMMQGKTTVSYQCGGRTRR